ncbi:DUF423 domain-containing protein [Solitalea koreensis]|uniref:Uncharacterized membrane protein YgdD, TMEM256/DUF423 family n=1 Tax=Solitalea koreensis TaxID=543615 RepID=A0A521ECC8_9SPHI|nr:DUF423 domain-containing protein [Solitalea koreensis]SMO81452.1 Uncharacterized membrane protein YgdD, TMEM256/DUF423 family [Solitalea koreensis]
MQKTTLILVALSGMLAVALGAFGAHGLKNVLTPDQMAIWEKGIQYQFYHTFPMLVLAFYPKINIKGSFIRAIWFFLAGILLFSGSLYIIAVKDLIGLSNINYIGIITPIGGVSFILGWLSILWGALRERV